MRQLVLLAALLLLLCEPIVLAGGEQAGAPRRMEILIESAATVFEEDSVSVRLRNILPPFLLFVAVMAYIRHRQSTKKEEPAPFVDKLAFVPPGSRNLKRDGDVVIVIPTMRRFMPGETTPTDAGSMGKLVRQLYEEMDARESEHVSFILYNVDPVPTEHTEVGEVVRHVPGVEVMVKHKVEARDQRSRQGAMAARQADAEEIRSNWQSNETFDAAQLLEKAQAKAEYVLFLEDDVIPTQGAMRKIFAQIQRAADGGIDDYVMMDLYTPLSPWSSPLVNNLERFEFKCCTQAMLFRSRRLPELIAYLRDNGERPLDEVIAHWCRHDLDGRKVYAMMPNPFEHGGAHSTLAAKSSSAVEHSSLNFDTEGAPPTSAPAVSTIFGGKQTLHPA